MAAFDHFHPQTPIETLDVPQNLTYNWEYDSSRASA
jgi:hypothetical protein